MVILICIKQHLSNIKAEFMEKLSNTEAELKKSIAYKKACSNNRAGIWKMFYKKDVLRFCKNYRRNTCPGFSFLIKFQVCSYTCIFLSILQKF